MSNPITQARKDVAAALAGIEGLQVFEFIPQKMSAPAAVVTPGGPYVVPGQVFGEFQIAIQVRLFAKSGTNQVITEGLDALIVSVCSALHEFGVVQVDRPGIDAESYDTAHLVTDITINTTYRNEES